MKVDKCIKRIIGKPIKKDYKSKDDELVHTGGAKEFYYPTGHTLEDTPQSLRFKKAYKAYLKKKNR